MPHYKQIGTAFKLGKTGWQGPVVASPDALLMLMRMKASTAAVGHHFGLLGALVASGIATLSKPSQSRTCDIADLDPGIRNHPDWPLRKVTKGDLVIIPRDAVGVMKHPRWSNVIKFENNGAPCSIDYLVFRGKSVRQFLIDSGWELDW